MEVYVRIFTIENIYKDIVFIPQALHRRSNFVVALTLDLIFTIMKSMYKETIGVEEHIDVYI